MSVIFEVKDNGTSYKFEIQKMPATQAEDFMYRLFEIAGSNIDFTTANGAGDLIKGLARCEHKEAKALLDELLFCCYRIVGNTSKQVSYDDVNSYITSPITLMKLRLESAKVNFGFFTELGDWFSHEVMNFTPNAQNSEASPDSST